MDITFFEHVPFNPSTTSPTSQFYTHPIHLFVFDQSLSGPPPHSSDMISPLPTVHARQLKVVPLQPPQTGVSPAPPPTPPQATMCKSWAASLVPACQPSLQPLDTSISSTTSTAIIHNLSSIRIPTDHKEAAPPSRLETGHGYGDSHLAAQ